MIRVNIVRLCLNYLHVPILSGVFWLVRWRAAIEEYIWLFPKEWSENVLLHISLVVKVLDPHNHGDLLSFFQILRLEFSCHLLEISA